MHTEQEKKSAGGARKLGGRTLASHSMSPPEDARKPPHHRPEHRRPRPRPLLDELTVALDAFFLEHHECGGVVENIVDEELETISLICRRCGASVVLPLS
jgi:hypothetical protein